MSTTSCIRSTKCITMGNPCNFIELDFKPVFEIPNEPIIVVNGLPDATLNQTSNESKTNPKSTDDIDPCFGNWLEGRKVQKNSQDRTYMGIVEKYDEDSNLYSVVYQDGASEDLKWKQLREILVPLDISIPITALAAKKCLSGKSSVKSRKSSKGKRSEPAQTEIAELKTNSSKGKRKRTEPSQTEIVELKINNRSKGKRKRIEPSQTEIVEFMPATALELNAESAIVKNGATNKDIVLKDSRHFGAFVGRNVLKWSGNRHYFGEVKKYDEETMRCSVVYEDGKSEELEGHELENLLVPINTCSSATAVASKHSKQRKMHANRSRRKKKIDELSAIESGNAVDSAINAIESANAIESVSAIESGVLIESIDNLQTGSLIKSIDAMKTGSLIESIDACLQVSNPTDLSVETSEKQDK